MITIENEKLKVSVSSFGAELQSAVNKESGKEYIWQGDPAYWTGRAPILFPICGRLSDDTFLYDGNRYFLQKHGFARKSEFAPEIVDTSNARFTLLSNEKTKVSYPFDFALCADFSLDKNVLNVNYTVTNTGENEMYFSLGAHPAFNVALGGYVEFEKTESTKVLLAGSDGLICSERDIGGDGKKIVLTQNVFDDDALIFDHIASESATVYSENGDALVKMTFGKVPYLLLWAKPGAPYVCIEPWHGIPDFSGEPGEIRNKRSIVTLGAGEKFEFDTKIEFI
ncbi:MAG: aldose 1-epimerase family protein [Clostridiales bacterium]|nr:aldose 1-epimerase family protein [Clostridiales bacterium]